MNLRNTWNNNNWQCFGSGESAHSVFTAGNCSLLLDLLLYQWARLWGCTFSDNSAKWLPEVSEAPDYTHQSQESNSNSFFIRELRIWQLPFHFQSRNCACESLSLNISLYVRYIYGRNPPQKTTKTIKFLFFFLPFVHLQGNVEIET